jgi:hypothetical protein
LLLAPNPRGHGLSFRPLPHPLGSHPVPPRRSSVVHGSWGIPGMGGRPRLSKTWETSLTKVANRLAPVIPVCLDDLKKPSKLDELHQLIVIVPGVDPTGLRLHQHHRA